MEDYKKLVNRLRDEPKDSRKAVLSIYDLCIDAAYAIEILLDKLKYAEGERDVVTKRMIELENQNADLHQIAEKQETMNLTLTNRVLQLEKQLHEAKNELCYKCGKYREAHNGACDGCRWKERKQ